MTLNISTVSATRNQKGTVLRSESNAIENVIEKIECLRLARDHGTTNKISDKPERKKLDECQRKLSKCKISNRRSLNDEQDEEEDKEEDLIERGPSKSHFSTRRKPYSQNFERTSAFVNESARQIMQDKKCREIINSCLDKLQDGILERTSWENNRSESEIYCKDIYENDTTDDILLNEIMNGAFQPAQQVTENLADSYAKELFINEKTVVCRSESSGSSVSSLPESSVKLNFYQNSINSPEVSSPYTPQPSFLSCSPASSMESYDAFSPNGSYRTSINSRIPEIENNSVYTTSDKKDNLLEEIYGCDFVSSMNEVFNNLEKNKSQDSSKYLISQQSPSNSNDKSTNEFLKSDNSETTETLFWTDALYSPEKMQIQQTSPPELTDYTALLGYPNSNEQVDQSTESTVDFSQMLRSSNESLAISNSTFDEHERRNLTETKNNFKIPKSVASFQFTSNKLEKKIKLWPSLNLPTVKASERLKEALDPKEVEKAMINLLKKSAEELAHQDKDGDTMLMCLVGNPDELSKKMAYLIPLVERLSTITGALTMTNDSEQDALYLAALNCPQFSFVTGYLAATMLEKDIDISQRLYHRRGDTLIHSIARRGDTHKEILAEILMLKTVRGNGVFDLSRRNYDGRTVLHVAITSHNPLTKGVTSVAIVRLLLKYGADPRSKETKCGDNALHLAISNECDPVIVKLLLQTRLPDLVNSTNYNLDTPLHIAAAISDNIPLERQIQVCSLLVQAGARTNLTNHQGKTPLALASSQRKEILRNILCRMHRS